MSRFTNNEIYHMIAAAIALSVVLGVPAIKVFGGTDGAAFASEITWLTLAAQGVVFTIIGSVIGQAIKKPSDQNIQMSLQQPAKDETHV